MTIGFIGCGNMAQPIIKSIINNGLYAPEDVFVYDTDHDKLQSFCNGTNAVMCENENDVTARAETVFLCIKPQGFADLLPKIADSVNQNGNFVVSIAAGKEIAFIEQYLTQNCRIGRVFPNLNAAVCASASAYCLNNKCNDADRDLLGKIVSAFGTARLFPEEMIAQFGVLGGCSPAYTFMYIDSLAKAAEKNGIDRQTALVTAIQAVLGSALYMKESGLDPEELINRVCSKGGTTIEGVNILRNNDLPGIVCSAYEASLRRDKELSAK